MTKEKFLDPNIPNKSKTVEEKIQLFQHNNILLPLPTEIEISESGTCNRKCSFCPRSDPSYEDINEFIDSNLHSKLIDQLKNLNYGGVIRYSGFVEPLLDKNIYNLVKEVSLKMLDVTTITKKIENNSKAYVFFLFNK